MSVDRENRADNLRQKLLIAFSRRFPNTSESGVGMLVGEAMQSGQAQHHVLTGHELEFGEIVGAALASELGQMIATADPEDGEGPPVDTATRHAKAVENMTAQQKLTYAHKHGLK